MSHTAEHSTGTWGRAVSIIEGILPENARKYAPYVTVFCILMIFTALTVGVAMIDRYLGGILPFLSFAFDDHIGKSDMTVGLTIAFIKGAFVMSIFMHLSHEKSFIYRVMGFTAFFFIAMLLLCVVAFYDTPPAQPSMTVPTSYVDHNSGHGAVAPGHHADAPAVHEVTNHKNADPATAHSEAHPGDAPSH